MNADASCLPRTTLLRKHATMPDVLEKTLHFQQEEQRDYAEYGAEPMALPRERCPEVPPERNGAV